MKQEAEPKAMWDMAKCKAKYFIYIISGSHNNCGIEIFLPILQVGKLGLIKIK